MANPSYESCTAKMILVPVGGNPQILSRNFQEAGRAR